MSLSHYHSQHSKHLTDLFGYAIPLFYSSPQEEYQASQIAGMMDAGFFGKLRVQGKDRETLLHRLTTNEMRNLKTGESRVNIFTNAKGRVVDRVEMLAEEESYLLITSPGRGITVQKWIEKYTFREDVRTQDLAAQLGMLSLFGRESAARLEEALGISGARIANGCFVKAVWQDSEMIVHSPAGAHPARLNLVLAADTVPIVWEALSGHFTPIGFSAYEILRISKGIPAADHEIVEEYNPHEVGLYPFIDFEKGCYIGQEVIARLDSYQKVQRQLIGVKSETKANLLVGASVWREEQEVGKLTSVAPAPASSGAIGLAVLRKVSAQSGASVTLRGENGMYPAVLADIPF